MTGNGINYLRTKNFSEVLSEEMAVKNLTPEKLEALSGVPRRYLEALKSGDFRNLPPRPYVRGYLLKIAGVMSVNGEELWQLFRKEAEALKVFEPLNRLPRNRYALKKINRKSLIFISAAVLALVYLAVRFNDLSGAPTLIVAVPLEENLVVREPTFVVKGRVGEIDTLTINGERVGLLKNGEFEKSVSLEPGPNVVEFKAKRFLGRETATTRQIFFQPQ